MKIASVGNEGDAGNEASAEYRRQQTEHPHHNISYRTLRIGEMDVKMRALSRLFWKHHHKMLRAMRLCKDSTISIRYPK